MARTLRVVAAAALLLASLLLGSGAFAQKSGGVLKVYFFDSPASMSIHEEATIAAQGPMMGVFNNPRHVQAGRAAKRTAIDRAGSRERLVMGRG
jgi:hypothetical protein